jgi:hypothetical protein
MSKKKIVLILLVIIFGGYAGWQLLMPNEPTVNVYKWRYEEMSKPEYLQALRDFCKNELNDSIENLNYSQLIVWEHKYLTYIESQFQREEMPIAILTPYIRDGFSLGRCGEFSLCMNGLLLANGYKTRLVVDASKPVTKFKFSTSMIANNSRVTYTYPDQKVGTIVQDSIHVKINGSEIKNPSEHGIYVSGSYIHFDTTFPEDGSSIYLEFEYYKKADDHVWIEVWADNRWIHLDPTEQRFDDKYMYYNDWNKEINCIKAITKNSSGEMIVEDVTQDYIPKP